AYPVVRSILDRSGLTLAELIGDERKLRSLRPADFADERFGLPTVTDILAELEKPGRDPRPAFKTATFKEGVEEMKDLRPGMLLEGVVTNVAAFGAFVDVGVHQDGLVHVSALSDSYVSDPREVVKPGDVVKVKVLSVDIPRNRISLTMRLRDEGAPGAAGGRPSRGSRQSSGTNAADSVPSRPAPRPAGPRPGGSPRGGGADAAPPVGRGGRLTGDRRCAPGGARS